MRYVCSTVRAAPRSAAGRDRSDVEVVRDGTHDCGDLLADLAIGITAVSQPFADAIKAINWHFALKNATIRKVERGSFFVRYLSVL